MVRVRFFEVLHATNSIRSFPRGRPWPCHSASQIDEILTGQRCAARPVHCDIVLVNLSRNANVCYSIRTRILLFLAKSRKEKQCCQLVRFLRTLVRKRTISDFRAQKWSVFCPKSPFFWSKVRFCPK